MNFFNWIKQSSQMLQQIEDKVYTQKSEFVEVYKRNLALEKEIAQRTEELDKANKTLLTLRHIWDMMNSSKPLANVLDAIVVSLQGELDYLYSCIISFQEDETGEFYAFNTYTQNGFLNRINKHLEKNVTSLKLKCGKDCIVTQALNEGKIKYTQNISLLLKQIIPDITEKAVEETSKNALTKCVIILPLRTSNEPFGCLIVFSPRPEPTESELNFLNLFANQIELALTIANLFETVKKQAVTDGLTELYNRRYFEEALFKEVDRASRLKQPFSVIGLDLDHLKEINDKNGHAAGDLAICAVAKAIKETSRSIDIAARFGGEEFNILLPGIDSAGATRAAERLRESIANQKIEDGIKVTASIGVGTFLEHTTDPDELLELVDKAMYKAKRDGRNRVEIVTADTGTSWQEIAINAFIDILEQHRIPVSKDVSKDLAKKLQTTASSGRSPRELLYSVADIVSQSYTPSYNEGLAKDKVALASQLAKRMDLPRGEIDKLKIAILMYDIGNTMVPEKILQKNTPLNEKEKEKIAQHPVIAAREILKPISTISDIIPIIEHHHENWDGTGYPAKIRGKEIPLTSQIILIVDTYTALISDRPYRPKISESEALEVIRQESGKKWSKELTKEFIEIIKTKI